MPTSVFFTPHARQRMLLRSIPSADVLHVLSTGMIIEQYPDDQPYPSRLLCGWCKGKPLHVVTAYDNVDDIEIIITTYIPNPIQWVSPDYLQRR